MTFIKAEMVKVIGEKKGFALRGSPEFVDQVFDIQKETLEGGEKGKISGFGNFNIRAKRPRRGRNLQTGEEMAITGRSSELQA